ncbi:MAG TPA: diacylglycerol kinase family protein [Candidatus Polarisedimenticolaceae bacterium]|nr:diacylglycerol kinase family protein [Candidatus Polarisedimenticolaceae bacterium]
MTVRPRRVLVVANPAAGLSRGRPAGELAARAARGAGRRVDLALTEGPGDAERFAAAAAADGYDLVVAAGGDGTVNEAANGIGGTGTALGVAPAGTMNLLARVLRLPLDPARAVARIAEGYAPLSIRPGIAGERLFLLMLGAGFDAWVLRELLRGVAGKIRFADYVRGAIRGLRTFPFPALSVEFDTARCAAHSAIVGRAPLYGGFLRPTPHARLDRDRLELCAIDGGALHLAAVLPRMWSGAHGGRDGITLALASRVAVRGALPELPYQIDGELAGTLPVTIGLATRAVVLAIPAGR